MMDEAKQRCIANCLFCSSQSQTDLDKTSPWYLGVHTCHLHVDAKKDGPSLYVCHGINQVDNGRTPCTEQFLTPEELIDHMKSEHTNQPVPFHLQYKAAMSDFLAECSVLASLNKLPAQSSPISSQTEVFHSLCDYVLFKRKEIPNLDPEKSNSEASGFVETAMETGETSTTNTNVETMNIETADAVLSTAITQPSVSEQNEISADLVSSTTSTEEDGEDGDAMDTSESAASTPSASGQEATSTAVIPKRRPSGRGRAVFISNNFRILQRQLKARYPKTNSKSTGEVRLAKCSKCGVEVTYGSDPRGNMAVRHAMTCHISRPAFSCKLCDRELLVYSAWYSHFQYHHPDQKKDVDSGSAVVADFYIDRRRELEEEIVQVTAECFLS